MEEDSIDLIGYVKVIWKRKIFIIVVTLICLIVAGVAGLKSPGKGRAQALVRIGKILNTSSGLSFLDTPENIVKIIPVEYLQEDKEALKYGLDAEVVKGTSLIKIVLEGPSMRKAKEFLEGVIEKILEDHHRITERSIQIHNSFIEKWEEDIREIQKDIDKESLAFKELSVDIDNEMDIDMSMETKGAKDIKETDPFTLMIQNNTLRMKQSAQSNRLRMMQVSQRDLKQSRNRISSTWNDILLQQIAINSVEREKTKLIGGVKGTVIGTNKRRNVMLGGVAGLMISCFLALLKESLGGGIKRKRAGEKGDNV